MRLNLGNGVRFEITVPRTVSGGQAQMNRSMNNFFRHFSNKISNQISCLVCGVVDQVIIHLIVIPGMHTRISIRMIVIYSIMS